VERGGERAAGTRGERVQTVDVGLRTEGGEAEDEGVGVGVDKVWIGVETSIIAQPDLCGGERHPRMSGLGMLKGMLLSVRK